MILRRNLIDLHRKCQLLHIYVLCCFDRLLQATAFFSLGFFITVLYHLFKLGSDVNYFLTICVTPVTFNLALTLNEAGKCCTAMEINCKSFIHSSMLNACDCPLHEKLVLKNLRPLRFKIRYMFTVDKRNFGEVLSSIQTCG